MIIKMRKLQIVYHLIGVLLVTQDVISVRSSYENRNSRRRNGLQKQKFQQAQHHQHHHPFYSDDIQKLRKFQPKQDDFQISIETDEFSINDSDIRNEENNSDSEEDEFFLRSKAKKENIASKPYDFYSCCELEFGSCREKCENLQLAQFNKTDGLRWELKKYCPLKQMDFWNCMNVTIEAVANGIHWSGRRCCHLGFSIQCQNACATSKSVRDLSPACRWSDEQVMLSCFERYEDNDRCCKNARTSECFQACQDVFEQHGKSKQSARYQYLKQQCTDKNRDVVRCVQNVTNIEPITDPHKFLPCCKLAKTDGCRQKCRIMLNSNESMESIIGELENSGCSNNLPNLEISQCFLNISIIAQAANPAENSKRGSSQLNEIGIDSAKLHCCDKADSKECRALCTQLYTNSWWQTRDIFESTCLDQPNELKLKQCINEVDQPCELGCDGLSFCTNFNNRPTELFRSCSPEYDMAAREDLKLLQQNGSLNLFGVNLFIRNTTKCAPEKWKAIVCALQLKPCTRQKHYNNICREDCDELLKECLDWTQLGDTLHGHHICARLAPNNPTIDTPCISLKPFLEESDVPKDTGGHHAITLTCKGNPCKENEACIAGRNGTKTVYQCVPACALGETSNYLVPYGSFVRLPSPETSSFKLCRCGDKGRIQQCQPLPQTSYEDCMLANNRTKHGSTFYLDCNVCSCFAEEMTCTKRQCRYPGYTDLTYTSLPCNCPTHYVPVCGWNGNTYHSACLAKCMGLHDTEFEYGACSIFNHCREGAHDCPTGTQCIEQRRICLSSMQKPCHQYQCVNQTSACVAEGEPVCDIKGTTYSSICSLQKAKARLDYWGNCQKDCSLKGPVCGINGVTYSHECAAWADYILVDYKGRCREVGMVAQDMEQRCRTVRCPYQPSRYCNQITPPGACCPICTGGALRIIYSRKQLDRAIYALRKKYNNIVTLRNLLKELDGMVQIAECQLTGMVTIEAWLFVGIVPRSPKPTRLQIEACSREAERLSNLISSQSHKITSNVILSSLIASNMVELNLESTALRPNWSLCTLILSLIVFKIFQ